MSENLFEFEGFVLDRGARELRRDGVVVPLQRIPLELLCLLLERRGELVTREEILERVWGKGVFVDVGASINTALRKIRRALHDSPDAPRFVATIPAKGYRFVAGIGPPKANDAERYRGRPRGAMVGREHELSSLRSGLEDASSGRGRLFLISGEPGVGKTRLADEVAVVAAARGMSLLVGHCTEQDEAVAYLPFVEILESFVDRVSSPERLRSVLGDQGPELARLLPKLKNILPELPPPLDLPPAQARRHLFNSFSDFAARVAREQPTLMILDDLHWADDSTLSLLDHLTPRLSGLSLAVIGTYRDAPLNVTRRLAKTLEDLLRARSATWVRLKDLSRDEVAAMLRSLSAKSPPASVVSEVYAETDGNPFFVEELFRHLEEENRLYDSAGLFRSDLKLVELEAPPSVRLVVARRLGRLSDPTQKMLATAATIGRFFNFELLQAAGAVDADSLLGCVEEAERAGLIFPVADSRGARLEFSHELIRQAVIGGVSARRRQRLHLGVADAIERICSAAPESTHAQSLDEHVAELAHHYARGSNAGKAAEYCLRALWQFRDLGSNAEAIAQFESGIELLRELPDDDRRAGLELDLRIAVGQPLADSKGFASLEYEQSLTRSMELCQRPGIHWERAWWILYQELLLQLLRPDIRKAATIGGELISRLEDHPRLGQLADVVCDLAWIRMYAGEFALAAHGFEQSWASLESIAKPATDLAPLEARYISQARTVVQRLGTQQNNRIVSGWNLWFLGYPDRARERMNAATAISHLGPRTVLVDTYGYATYICELRREPEQMRAQAEARLALAKESGYVIGCAVSEMYLAWADAMASDFEGGVARMRRSMLELKAVGTEAFNDRCLAFIATALGRMGHFDEGLRTIDEAFPFIERTGQRYYEAEAHRVKGELLLALGPSNAPQAEQSFLTALDVSRKQRAKSWELRAATSLARLLSKHGRRDEARAMLSEIYGWFTEGLDTGDLKDAKALLDELSA